MFANRDRTITRRLVAIAVGIFAFVAAVVAFAPTGAGAAPLLGKLKLSPVCTLPSGQGLLRVTNVGILPRVYTVTIDGMIYLGGGIAPAGDSAVVVPGSTRTTRIHFLADEASTHQSSSPCVFHVRPEKQWLDADGAPIESPDVPDGWTLTLSSDLETVSCIWSQGALACDDGALEVPFGGSYAVSESATDQYTQSGAGAFGPLAQPSDLDGYVAGDDTFDVVVTNQLIEAPDESSTTTVAPDESSTTTVAPDESSTTTVAPDESSTTTVAPDESSTTTVAPDESSTTTVAPDESSTTTVAPDESSTTTVAPDESSTTTTVGSDERVTEQATSSTVDDSSTTIGATTTFAPLPSESPTTTAATTTTAAPTPSDDPGAVGDATLRAAEVPDAAVEPASDTLPVTGADSIPVAWIGVGLMLAGGLVVAIGRRRAVV